MIFAVCLVRLPSFRTSDPGSQNEQIANGFLVVIKADLVCIKIETLEPHRIRPNSFKMQGYFRSDPSGSQYNRAERTTNSTFVSAATLQKWPHSSRIAPPKNKTQHVNLSLQTNASIYRVVMYSRMVHMHARSSAVEWRLSWNICKD